MHLLSLFVFLTLTDDTVLRLIACALLNRIELNADIGYFFGWQNKLDIRVASGKTIKKGSESATSRGNCLLCIVPSSDFRRIQPQELAKKMITEKTSQGSSLRIKSKSVVWMPYYKIGFEYKRSEQKSIKNFSETAQGETVMNAMFCGFASESDLPFMFRPNYLRKKMETCNAQQSEIIGPVFQIDLDTVLAGFLAKLNKVKDEYRTVRSDLTKRYFQTRKYSMLFPMMGKSKEIEKQSKKVAELDALTHIMNLCLNLTESAASIKTLYSSIFYYPTMVIAFATQNGEALRFLVLNLVKEGAIHKSYGSDNVLTEFCNRNSACKEELSRLLPPPLSPT